MTDSKSTNSRKTDDQPSATPQGDVTEKPSQDKAPQTWFARFWPLITAATVSIIWIGLCIWWFMDSEKTISRMPTYEAGGLLAGASLPLILVWLIALVYLRTDPLRDHRAALTHGIEGLLNPLDVAQKRVNSIVVELHKEIKHIGAASDIAVTRIDNLENRFQEQISSLFEVTTDAEAKATNIQMTLSTERKAFSGLVDDVTEQIRGLEKLFSIIKTESQAISKITQKNSEVVSNEITFQNKTLKERTKLIDDQLEKMALNLRNISSEIRENNTASETTLSQMAQTLLEKQTILMANMTDLSENSAKICGQLDAQSQNIAQLNDKAIAGAEKITETLTEQSTNLFTAAEDAIQRSNESALQITNASDVFKSNADDLVEHSEELSHRLIKHMGLATDDLHTKSEILEHTISLRLRTTQESLDNQSQIIREALIEQSKNSSDFITKQNKELVDGLEHKFSNLMALMQTQTDQIQKLAQDTTDQLANTVASMENQASKVDQAVKLTTENLDDNTHKMDDHYQSFKALSDSFRNRIEQTEKLFESQQTNFVETLTTVIEQMEYSIQNVKDQSGSLGQHAQEVISNIIGQTDQLSEHIDHIRNRTESTIRNIQEMGETISHHFTATDSHATTLSENWVNTTALVENQCAETLSKLDHLTQKLHDIGADNENALDTAENTAAKVSEQMQEASESIFLASASAVEAADETNRLIDEHSEKFQQLINALQLSNKSILIDAETIEQRNKEKVGAEFSKLASRVVEQLQSISIDINRYFEGDVPDKVWQNYVDGDKNTFVRRLKKITNKKEMNRISEKYKSDSEFRKHTMNYMHAFEELISHSLSSEVYNSFSVALISSETGKIYLALAQATNRLSA